jgi:hypothetical protein
VIGKKTPQGKMRRFFMGITIADASLTIPTPSAQSGDAFLERQPFDAYPKI